MLSEIIIILFWIPSIRTLCRRYLLNSSSLVVVCLLRNALTASQQQPETHDGRKLERRGILYNWVYCWAYFTHFACGTGVGDMSARQFVRMFQLENRCADFSEIWCARYVTGGQHKHALWIHTFCSNNMTDVTLRGGRYATVSSVNQKS
jgi:hypothetical protein